MTVRRVRAGDEAAVRSVRLRALADSPDDFDSSLELEEAWKPADWRRWIARGATFVLEHDGRPQGISAGVPDGGDGVVVYLAAVWLEPALRGSGLADRLVTSVIEWAESEGATDVLLHVDARNGRARGFYERHGFRATGEEIVRERDGLPEVEMRLRLGRLRAR